MVKRACLRAGLMAGAATVLALSASPAWAESDRDVAEELKQLRALIDAQSRRLEAQEQALAAQQKTIEAQSRELRAMHAVAVDDLGELRGTGPAPAGDAPAAAGAAEAPPAEAAPPAVGAAPEPVRPVGEAPPEKPAVPIALPEGAYGVLTPKGRWVVEPAFEFVNASTDRLVFRGVELVPGIQLGVIEASNADRNTLSASVAYRYGVTNRFELEARFAYVYRHDRVTTLQQRDDTVSRTQELNGSDIGDVELTGRWQINRSGTGLPVFVAALGVKSDTGTGPFDIPRDEFGVATRLATGSGFWAITPSVSFMYPSDPVVLYGNLGYVANLSRNVDEDFGDATHPFVIGNVSPGDSITAGLGFGFSVNERFSYSLGYKHSYVFPTDTEINGVTQSSTSLQVGALQLSGSFRLNDRLTLSASFELGATEDAPDVRMLLRLPVRF